MCADDVDMARNDRLKGVLNQYFDKQSTGETDLELAEPEPVSVYVQ